MCTPHCIMPKQRARQSFKFLNRNYFGELRFVAFINTLIFELKITKCSLRDTMNSLYVCNIPCLVELALFLLLHKGRGFHMSQLLGIVVSLLILVLSYLVCSQFNIKRKKNLGAVQKTEDSLESLGIHSGKRGLK